MGSVGAGWCAHPSLLSLLQGRHPFSKHVPSPCCPLSLTGGCPTCACVWVQMRPRRPTLPWTGVEEVELRRLVGHFGTGDWGLVREEGRLVFQDTRSNVGA